MRYDSTLSPFGAKNRKTLVSVNLTHVTAQAIAGTLHRYHNLSLAHRSLDRTLPSSIQQAGQRFLTPFVSQVSQQAQTQKSGPGMLLYAASWTTHLTLKMSIALQTAASPPQLLAPFTLSFSLKCPYGCPATFSNSKGVHKIP